MTTFGDQLFQYGGSAVGGPLSTGPVQYVKGSTGSDGNSGKRPDRAVKTWGAAQTNMSADKNGVIYFVAESNSAGSTNITLPAAATFAFSKNGVKVQGINQNGVIGQRSRVTIAADAANVTPMVNWSASNSSCANVHFVYEEADAGDKVCFQVSGERNHFYRCHFAGIVNATQDVAGAASLVVTGDENLFEECTIGVDTTDSGSVNNTELLFTAAATASRNIFRNCLILTYATSADQHFIEFPATGIDRFVLFDNCTFLNAGVSESPGNEMTEALEVNANPGGSIVFKDCCVVGAVEWDATNQADVWVLGATGLGVAAGPGTSGIALETA